jgi:hypothetical protein
MAVAEIYTFTIPDKQGKRANGSKKFEKVIERAAVTTDQEFYAHYGRRQYVLSTQSHITKEDGMRT